MPLKHYQEQSLRVLREYLDAVPLRGAASAYLRAHNNNPREFFRQRNPAFQPLEGLEEVPYVCLRLPTGGGKTLLCAHTVGLAKDALWQDEFPLVLWLVPSEVIRTQTLETLKTPNHANSRALQERFGSRFRVFDVVDFVNIRPQDLRNHACIVVATFAAFRVKDTKGRNAYDHHEDLEGHFSQVNPNTPNLERNEDDGTVKYSFANLLHVQRPLVLVDEAHNAKSDLSMEVLKRVNPRAVIEYTATPANNSNLIESVSAQDLKDEEMIKLPIVFTAHDRWQQAIAASIQTRAKLEQAANQETDYLRPLVLFQAENKTGEVTVEVLKHYLCEQENIPPEHIAIATGDQRELDGLNLFDPYCPVRYIITVKALKEGWDCSFAYVLCALANTRSNTEVEQLLGRVLRMPYAQKRKQPELNQAYAHVSSQSWTHAVSQMEDRLISMGFEQSEAERALQLGLSGVRDDTPSAESANQDAGLLFAKTDAATFTTPLTQVPDLTALDAAVQAQVSVTTHDDGRVVLQVHGSPDAALLDTVAKSVSNAKDQREIQLRADKWWQQHPRNATPAERGVPFIVPQLCFALEEDITLPLEAENCLGADGWNPLDDYHPILDAEFSADEQSHVITLDIENEKLRIDYLSTHNQLPLAGVPTDMDATDLALSMERRLFLKLEGQYMADGSLRQYLLKSVRDVLARHDMSLPLLLRTRVALEKVLETRLLAARRKAYARIFQQQLFAPEGLRAGAEYPVFTFPEAYPVSSRYDGRKGFKKHYYRQIAAMNGEEAECALVLDQHARVTHWIRNLEKQPRSAFWLPTSSDKFYPDFVAQLDDGRILVVEYKGEHLKNNPDTLEKTAVGRVWAKTSGHVFLMAFKQDDQGRDVATQVRQVVGV